MRAVAAFLTEFADGQGQFKQRAAHLERAAEGVRAAVAAIAAEDSPAQGIDAAEVFEGGADPQTVFAGGANPAEVFAGNAPAAPLQIASAAAVASAPVPSTAPAQALDLDADGLPWDGRIHASTRSKIQAGTWKVKRGVDDAVIEQVKAELRAVLGNVACGAIPTTAAASSIAPQPAPTAAVAALAQSATIGTPATSSPNVPPPPPPNTAPAAPAVTPIAQATSPAAVTVATGAPAPSSISFPQLCARITSALSQGQLTQEALGAALAANNLQGLPTLAAFPHLVQPVAAALGFA